MFKLFYTILFRLPLLLMIIILRGMMLPFQFIVACFDGGEPSVIKTLLKAPAWLMLVGLAFMALPFEFFVNFLDVLFGIPDKGIGWSVSSILNSSSTYSYNYSASPNMDGHQFEEYCANLLRLNGYKQVSVTPGSGDYGADILATKDGHKYAIQCKYYNSKIGVKAVQEVMAGKTYYHCDRCAVLTNNGFTDNARELALRGGVELWDGQTLSTLERGARTQRTEQSIRRPKEAQQSPPQRNNTASSDINNEPTMDAMPFSEEKPSRVATLLNNNMNTVFIKNLYLVVAVATVIAIIFFLISIITAHPSIHQISGAFGGSLGSNIFILVASFITLFIVKFSVKAGRIIFCLGIVAQIWFYCDTLSTFELPLVYVANSFIIVAMMAILIEKRIKL